MTDVKKTIEAEELSTLQNQINKINALVAQVGELETVKDETLAEWRKAKRELDFYFRQLNEKYGEVQINLSDGTITDAPVKEN